MTKVWRLIIDEPHDGATNMARDEAMAAVHERGSTPPTLRLYRWAPACLSLGRFQRTGAIDRAACARADVTIVRRPSGGRALLHDHELTYAIVARAGMPELGGESILASYQRISLALLAGLQRLGVAAELTPVDRQRRSTDSAACFDSAASFEITAGKRKLAGGAQARRGTVLLQHGAIPLTPHAERLAALLHEPPADLGAKMTSLATAAGRAIGFDELAAALIGGFASSWGIALEQGQLTQDERAAERQLHGEKYSSDDWTFGR